MIQGDVMKHLTMSIAMAAIIASSGCSWLSRETSAVVPAELDKQINQRGSAVTWSKDTGSGNDELAAKLEATLSGSSIYVADADGRVSAVDSNSGATLWNVDVDLDLRGGPGVGGGLVVVGSTEGDLVALTSGNGSESWRAKLDSEIAVVPLVANGMVVAHTTDGKLVGINAASGETTWVFHRSGPSLRLRGAAQPVVDGEYLYSGLDAGKLVKLDIATGRSQWETPISWPSGRNELDRVVDIDSRPVVTGNRVYTVSYQGQMAAVGKKKGAVEWSIPFSSHQGLAFDGTVLYAANARGNVVAVDSANGHELWRQKALHGRRLSAPALAGGYLAVADYEGYVHWLSPADGSLVARIRAVKSAVQAPLVTSGNRVIVYGSEGQLASVSAP
ncbi:outer membrane protein assembly factor BamB [Solemya velum gill symbiont]|nr:outer membrane protein assembly factor BamB [Solemya velum gill symbiont]OOZ47451.1 outer membrane protein assembly factor BamB [Solemya velum gill symbiont]OOZ49920.1 outer membrane protein assembly factor BamB [Solemya velum gill symbiont]OOZ51658.1 outer membrane protein assembly factor BamB [Solemya velum gill symbiont]OOZ55546.1 outer membrane protein assembly factor BamB [Solemya velum gill symbiont]